MRDELGQYFENVMAIKHAWNSGERLNTEKLSKIWFAKDNGDKKLKTNKLSTMIEEYNKEKTDDNWKKFSEIYILRHLSQDTVKKYKKLFPTYKKIKDLEAKAANLKEQVALFYQKLGGKTFNKNINLICKWFESKSKNKTVRTQFLIYAGKSDDIYNNFKIFFETLEKINEMYDDDEVKKICEKYKNEDKDGVAKFFSSMVNRVHFFEDYKTIIKKIPALGSECLDKTNEYKFRDTAQKILGEQLESNLDIEKNFAFLLVRSLEKLNKILDNRQNENKNQHNEEIESLKQIYEKYNKLCSGDLRSLEDMKVIFKNNDGKFEFEIDFQQIQDILKKMDIKDCDVFNKCLSIFETDVLPDYEREMKRRDNFSNFVKFIETGIANGYFSDAQICNMDIINIFDENDLQSYTLEAEIKKLHVMVGSAGRDRLKTIAKDLCPKNRLEYVICDSDQPDQYISAMRKLFLHMDYSKAKTFIKDYDFKSFPNIENQGQNQINTYQRKFNAFGRTLQNTLLDLFESSEYKKIDFKGKFILGGCFFESMLREACRYYELKVEKEFDDLFKMVRERILSVLTNPPQLFNSRLSDTKELLEKTSLNTSLNELIACAFLSAHIYICSRHVDGDDFDEDDIEKSIINLGDEFYDKIISMLARSTAKEEKFKDIKDVKKWINESSLKYFIQGTFNLKDIPENERTDDQMELEQTKLIQNYNERILEHILSKIDKSVSVFDVLENIYLDDKNKVVYKFRREYLLYFLKNKVMPASKTCGKKEAHEKHFLTLLKFLKRIGIGDIENTVVLKYIFNYLLKCAKNLGLLDEKGKFVDEKVLKMWIRNVLPTFDNSRPLRRKFIDYMADNLGDNISFLDLIDILQEESKQEPRLIGWFGDCPDDLYESYKPYKNGEKQNRDVVKKKFEDVLNFLDKISGVEQFDFNLLNLFPLLDTINEISVDDQDDTKKFKTFDDLKKICDTSFFDGESNCNVRNLLRFLYAISRIPKDKTLLDVIKEDKYRIEKIFPNGYQCSCGVFEGAVQAVYDCLSKENITAENRNEYVNFVYQFFSTIKTDAFLDHRYYGITLKNQIEKLEQGKNVFLRIGKIFNLLHDKSSIDSIVELSKYIDKTFADERNGVEGYDYRIPILCSIFCESIENMTIEDILSDKVQFIWKVLDKLHGRYRKELSLCCVDELKKALNAKIKDHLEEQNNDEMRKAEVKKILYAFHHGDRYTPEWLNFEPLYDVLNSSILVKDTDSQKLLFKDDKSLNEIWSNLAKRIQLKSGSMLPHATIRFIYALSRLPQNTSVIDILKMTKINSFGKICLTSEIDYKSQIDFLKDFILKIETEIDSNKEKYTKDKTIFYETIDLLANFLKGIINGKPFDDYLCEDKDGECHVNAKAIVSSSLKTLKTLLSEYQFSNFTEINKVYNLINCIFNQRTEKEELIKNGLNNILKSMKLKMLDRCHIFEFLDNIKDKDGNYEDWIKKDKDLCKQLLEKMEQQFDQYQNMPSELVLVHNSYKKTNIEFFIRYADKKYFERVVRLAAKICYGYVDEDNNFVRFAVCRYNLEDWIISFENMFYSVGAVDVDIVRKTALEYIILNFGDKINVFDILFLLQKRLYYDVIPEKLTTLDQETSKKLVDKILADKLCEGLGFTNNKGYNALAKHGKINFVSQLLQEIGVEIEAKEKQRLFNELKKQSEQEQKKLMEQENKKRGNNELYINDINGNKDKNKNKIDNKVEIKVKPENIPTSENRDNVINNNDNNNVITTNNSGSKENGTGKENKKIENNELETNSMNIDDNQNINTGEIKDEPEQIILTSTNINKEDKKIDQEKTEKPAIVSNVNNNRNIAGKQLPFTLIDHANTINSFSGNYKENKKSKPLLKYLFWFLTVCIASLCIYFFATSAITEAIITLIITVIMFVASILITKYNTKKPPQYKMKTTVQSSNDEKIIQRSKDLSPEMPKEKNMSKNDISDPNQ